MISFVTNVTVFCRSKTLMKFVFMKTINREMTMFFSQLHKISENYTVSLVLLTLVFELQSERGQGFSSSLALNRWKKTKTKL